MRDSFSVALLNNNDKQHLVNSGPSGPWRRQDGTYNAIPKDDENAL